MTDGTAVVTGSSRGIGLRTAELLLERGLSVIGVSRSAPEARLLDEAGFRWLAADVSTAGGCRRVVEAAAAAPGPLRYLVNNAGQTRFIRHGDLAEAGDDVWMDLFQANVLSAWRLCVGLRPHFAGPGSGVVNVASSAGLFASGSSIPYGVSKAALIHLTTMIAPVFGPDVRVNAVAPGLVRTAWHDENGADWDGYGAKAALGRPAEADDIADTVVALLTGHRYVTGQTLLADGGFFV